MSVRVNSSVIMPLDSNHFDVLQAIDLNTNSTDLGELRAQLLHDGPNSIIAYYFIDNFLRWLTYPFYKFDEDEYWCDAAKITVYCPEGRIEYGIIVCIVEYKNGRVFVMTHCVDKKNIHVMKDVLITTEVLNWTKSLTFEGVQEELVPILREVIAIKNKTISYIYEKKLLIMPNMEAEKVKLEYPPEEIYVDRVFLKKSHIKLVNQYWVEQGEDSEFLVETLVRNNRGAAVYRRDEAEGSAPLAWGLRQHWGGIGMLNTTSALLRDLLPLVIKFMVRYSVIDEIQPFTCIWKGHYNIIKIFSDLGCNHIGNVYWITTEGLTGYKYTPHYEKFKFNA